MRGNLVYTLLYRVIFPFAGEYHAQIILFMYPGMDDNMRSDTHVVLLVEMNKLSLLYSVAHPL